jgi:hypothetical protein
MHKRVPMSYHYVLKKRLVDRLILALCKTSFLFFFLVVTFVLLIASEDEQLLFRLFIDDNDEKVVGANHLRANVLCTFRFISGSLCIHIYTCTAVISKPIIIFTLRVFSLLYSDFSFRLLFVISIDESILLERYVHMLHKDH